MMQKNILSLILVLILAATGCMATDNTNDGPNLVDTGDDPQIYAAAIREIHSFAESSIFVYVVTTTEDMAIFETPMNSSQKLPADLQAAITTELADEQYELIWIEAFEDAPTGPINEQTAEGWHIADGQGILITLGNLHPQDDGSVQLSFFMSCADVCGLGKTLVLFQDYGHWHVIDSVGPVIAS